MFRIGIDFVYGILIDGISKPGPDGPGLIDVIKVSRALNSHNYSPYILFTHVCKLRLNLTNAR